MTKKTDIEYLEKRTITDDYDPVEKFNFDTWKDAFSSSEIKTRYESLHNDLLYTDKKQDFREAIKAFEKIDEIFSGINE